VAANAVALTSVRHRRQSFFSSRRRPLLAVRVYERLRNGTVSVCPSVCLSVPSIDSGSDVGLQLVCCSAGGTYRRTPRTDSRPISVAGARAAGSVSAAIRGRRMNADLLQKQRLTTNCCRWHPRPCNGLHVMAR